MSEPPPAAKGPSPPGDRAIDLKTDDGIRVLLVWLGRVVGEEGVRLDDLRGGLLLLQAIAVLYPSTKATTDMSVGSIQSLLYGAGALRRATRGAPASCPSSSGLKPREPRPGTRWSAAHGASSIGARRRYICARRPTHAHVRD